MIVKHGAGNRNSRPDVLLGKAVLKICSKFIEQHPHRSAILIKLQSNFIEITLWHGCSLVNLLHIFRTPFLKNNSGGLLLWNKQMRIQSPVKHLRWSFFLNSSILNICLCSVQVPLWLSNFAPGIKPKFKDFSGEI